MNGSVIHPMRMSWEFSFDGDTNREFFLGGVLVLLATVVVRHGDDRQDEVDQVERAHEDDDDEERHVVRRVRFDHLQQQPTP